MLRNARCVRDEDGCDSTFIRGHLRNCMSQDGGQGYRRLIFPAARVTEEARLFWRSRSEARVGIVLCESTKRNS